MRGTEKARASNGRTFNRSNIVIIILLSFILSIMVLPDAQPGSVAAQSQPGEEWVEQDSGTDRPLLDVTWGNGKFVAVGTKSYPDNIILTSNNGIHWIERNSGIENWLYGVTWGGGQFVAVGSYGTIITSTDGIHWSEQHSGLGNITLSDVAWNGNQYIAVGGRATILSSPDGIRWTEHHSGRPFFDNFRCVTWGNDQFVVVGSSGMILTSVDGVNWIQRNSPGEEAYMDDVTWCGNKFVGVGGVGYGNIFTSLCGLNWTRNTLYTSGLRGVICAGNQVVAVGAVGTIVTSPDGINWTERKRDASLNLTSVAWSGNQLVAVGRNGTILTSRGDDKVIEPPTLVSPADGAVIEDESITFRWNASPGANDYFLSIRRTVDNALVYSKPIGNVTSFTQSGFPLNGSEYSWKVRAGNGSSWSDFSEERTFTSYKASPDCTVSTPNRPSGPNSGETDTDYTYSTGGSSCTAGHGVQYQFSWRKTDGIWTVHSNWSYSSWSSSTNITLNFPVEGVYEIVARARCVIDNSIISNWSEPLNVSITKPEMPVGKKYTIAYIPVKYKGFFSPQPDRTMADLRERAGMVSYYYKKQSYNSVDLVSVFLSDERIELPKTFNQYTSQYNEYWAQYVIRDAMDIAGILPDNFDKNPLDWTKEIEEYDAVMVIAPTVPYLDRNILNRGGAFAMTDYPNILNMAFVEDRHSYATWAHELGHGIFKWFDYYSRKDYVWTRGNVGRWCLMGWGDELNPPAQVMTYNKALAGWLNYNDLEHDDYGLYDIELLHELSYGDQVYRYEPKAEHGLIDNYIDYFIIEGRNPEEESKGFGVDRHVNESRLDPDLGINLYYQLERDKEEENIDADGTYVYRIPYQLSGHEKVTLTPGDSHKCDYHGVKFKAKRAGGQLQLNISEHLITDRCVIFAREIEAIIDELDTSKASSLLSDYTLENIFDTNLIVYTDDGEIVGMCYENNEYVINIPGARSSGNIPGGGPEWISIPSGIEVSYKIDATPVMKWLEELGLAEIRIETTVERIEVDEAGERTVIRDDMIELVLYNIILIAKPEEGGEIYGGGVYEPDEEITITASANEGYKFVNWTENGTEISAESSYSFTVSGNRNLVANFDKVAYDPDMEWTERDSGTNSSLHSITWSGDKYVAVGISGLVLTSPDGENWTEQKSGTDYHLRAVTWGNNQFVAVGSDGDIGNETSIILTSPDGENWTKSMSIYLNALRSVTWNGNKFVAVGYDGSDFIGKGSSTVFTSLDGENWTSHRPNKGQFLHDVVWSGSQFVSVGRFGTILTSQDGENWVEQYSGTSKSLEAIAWCGNQFVVVGEKDRYTYGSIFTSSDGEDWTEQSPGKVNYLRDVEWGDNQYVAVGSNGTILNSPDGKNWTKQNSGTDDYLQAVTWGDNQFLAVGSYGTILGSGETTTPTPEIKAKLSDLSIKPGTLKPDFYPETTTYIADVSPDTSSINVTATLSDDNATLTINDEVASSGEAQEVPIGAAGTETAIDIVVTTEDEETTKTYTITVNRAEEPDSNGADLSALTVSEGTLMPTFDAAKTDYTVEVTHDTGSIDVTATLSDPEATMTINGAPATSGESETITLGEPGTATEIDIIVTAEDGEITNTYIINVKRKVPPVESIELTVDPENWQIAGEDITFTAEVKEGNEEAEFSFWYRVPGRDWVNAREYRTDNTWTTSTSYVGEVEIGVLARAKGSDAFEEARDRLDYELFKVAPVEEVKLSAEPEERQISGEPMTFTAEVTEGNQNAEFAFYYKLDGRSWTLGRNYSEDNTWEPKTSYVGEAKVGVIARAVGSDAFEEDRDWVDYEITAIE